MRAARLWRSASDETVETLARMTRVHEYKKGAIVFVEGTVPDRLGVIVDGHARASHSGEGRSIVVETFWPGDVVGAVSAVSELAFETDIEAAERTTVAFIPVAALKALIVTEPDVAMSVINEISREWVSAVNVSKRNAMEVHSRVASYLMDLPRTSLGGTAYAVEIPVSRVELAALLNTTPETLSRVFRSLQDDKILESHDRMIIVAQSATLTALRDGEHHPAVGARR
jgi:CRP/FNR family transcriptional regulator